MFNGGGNLYVISDVNMPVEFVSKFSAYYGERPCERLSNLRFGAALTFKLTARF